MRLLKRIGQTNSLAEITLPGNSKQIQLRTRNQARSIAAVGERNPVDFVMKQLGAVYPAVYQEWKLGTGCDEMNSRICSHPARN